MIIRPILCLASAATALMTVAPCSAQTRESNDEHPFVVPLQIPAVADNTPSSLTGKWGGLRTRLRDDGVDLKASYGSETAWNPEGGEQNRITETGQFDFTAQIDTEKLIGLKGGTFQAVVTYRRGQDLGAVANLGVLQQVQEVYGRGQTWRLTRFFYLQKFLDGHADVRFGRLTMGGEFGKFTCLSENLSFCGSPAGNLVGDYWYNWPVSQWGIRGRLRNSAGYIMVGAYEVNPRNLDNTFTIGYFHGATGVLLPAEIALTPRLGEDRLPGSYKLGGWVNTSNGNDVALDIYGQPAKVTGLAPLQHSSRYGVYAQFQQQLTGRATDAQVEPDVVQGLSVFFNATLADRATSTNDNQFATGLFYTGLLRSRPKDDFELAIARTHVNSRTWIGLPPGAARPNSEYAAEIDYGVHATGWLTLRPNLQYIVDPGGLSSKTNVVIVGMKGSVSL